MLKFYQVQSKAIRCLMRSLQFQVDGTSVLRMTRSVVLTKVNSINIAVGGQNTI